jgi:hypothetical protein
VESTDTHSRGSDVWRGRESGGVGVLGAGKGVVDGDGCCVWRQLAACLALEGSAPAVTPVHEPLPLSKQATAHASSVHLLSIIMNLVIPQSIMSISYRLELEPEITLRLTGVDVLHTIPPQMRSWRASPSPAIRVLPCSLPCRLHGARHNSIC